MVLVIGSRIYGHSNQSGRKKKGGKDKEEVQVKSYAGAAAEFGVWRVLSEAHTKCAVPNSVHRLRPVFGVRPESVFSH